MAWWPVGLAIQRFRIRTPLRVGSTTSASAIPEIASKTLRGSSPNPARTVIWLQGDSYAATKDAETICARLAADIHFEMERTAE